MLQTPAESGTVVATHHPPIAPDRGAFPMVNLRNAEALATVLAGSDVRAVLCGHFHLQLSGLLGGIPVWVSPGIVTRIDLSAPPRLERAVVGAGATVVDLPNGGAPMSYTVASRDPAAGAPVYLVDTETGTDVDDEDDAHD